MSKEQEYECIIPSTMSRSCLFPHSSCSDKCKFYQPKKPATHAGSARWWDETPADLQPEPIDEMSQYLRQTCVYRDTCVSTMKCRNCGVFMAEPVKPEAGRQVSRDFDTIEHEPEMPLREQFHRVLSRMNLPTWGGGISWNEALNWMVLIIEAHDSAVAAKAVKDAKEALECAEYAFLHPTSNQEFALNAVQQALAHIRAMAEE